MSDEQCKFLAYTAYEHIYQHIFRSPFENWKNVFDMKNMFLMKLQVKNVGHFVSAQHESDFRKNEITLHLLSSNIFIFAFH